MKSRFGWLFLGIMCLQMASSAATRAIEKPLNGTGVGGKTAIPFKANLFALEDVKLLDSPFRRAQETDRAYLLSLESDRFLHFMRKNAGLAPKAPPYGGWDDGGAGIIGHYLSACAQMAQATGDAELKRRVNYIVSEIAACQEARDGGLYAYDFDANIWFPNLAQGKVVPVPVTAWYVLHKIMAGLRDAWAFTGNQQARQVLVRLGDWCLRVTAKLSDEQWQQMLAPEHGAPHEVLSDIYAMTGERKYLDLAMKFRHAAVFEPLKNNQTAALNKQHANAQIVKFVGYERIYELNGQADWYAAATNFWSDVTANRTWANGGNSQWEAFFNPDETSAKTGQICGPETCNTYNMLKLTRQLFTTEPAARYMDFYERAMLNHILASQGGPGNFNYYTPMRPGHYRVFSRPTDSFWCCVGTGMENHAEYNEMIYAHNGNRLWVNLFVPSELRWREKNLVLRQENNFPEEARTKIIIKSAPTQNLTLSLRYPRWVEAGALKISINGQNWPFNSQPGSFVDIARTWKSGDVIEIQLPMRITVETPPHSDAYAAFFYGPILLAGDLGSTDLRRDDYFGGGPNNKPFNETAQLAKKPLPLEEVPVISINSWDVATKMRREGQELKFRAPVSLQLGGEMRDMNLVPFYKIHFSRYAIYWRVVKPADYAQEQIRYVREKRAAADLEKRTIDRVLIGDNASEAAHNLQSEKSESGGASGSKWRDAKGFFRYDLKISPHNPIAIRAVYWGSDSGRTFDIVVNDKVIATQELKGEHPDLNFEVEYPVPFELTRGKERVTVAFVPHTGSVAGGLFDLRAVNLPA